MIDSIEFHGELISSLEDAAPVIAVIVCWGVERKFVIESVSSSVVWMKYVNSFKSNKVSAYDFIVKAMDGAILESDFNDEVAGFLSAYVGSGAYYKSLENHFKIENIYQTPQDWLAFNSMFSMIDEAYEKYKERQKEIQR